MMKDIAIYGAGGLGRELACLIGMLGEHRLIGFFDDGKPEGIKVDHFGVTLGGIAELNAWPRELDVVLAFGDPATRSAVASRIYNPLIGFPNIIARGFMVSDRETLRMGRGNVITGASSFTTNTSIGDFNLFNGNVGLGHDVSIGNANVFMTGVHIAGGVTIGSCNLFGTGCFVEQTLTIGDGVRLSPLSALLTRPKDGGVYIGNPARRFRF